MSTITNPLTNLFGPGSPTNLPSVPPMPLTPPLPKAEKVELPADQQALLLLPWDPFNRAQHEAKMNAWYMATIENQNSAKLQIYVAAWRDYSLNLQHCMDLGIALPKPPAPPALMKVGPMPAGYWFS